MSNPGQESPDNNALRELRDAVKKSNHSSTINYIVGIVLTLVLIWIGFMQLKPSDDFGMSIFEKKQECSQYSDLANDRISNSGRVFENDTYSVKEIFYSHQLDSCLYAWVLYTTSDPKEIYSIDDMFGGDVFTASISELFYKEIDKLKK